MLGCGQTASRQKSRCQGRLRLAYVRQEVLVTGSFQNALWFRTLESSSCPITVDCFLGDQVGCSMLSSLISRTHGAHVHSRGLVSSSRKSSGPVSTGHVEAVLFWEKKKTRKVHNWETSFSLIIVFSRNALFLVGHLCLSGSRIQIAHTHRNFNT